MQTRSSGLWGFFSRQDPDEPGLDGELQDPLSRLLRMNTGPILLVAVLLGVPAGCGAPQINASEPTANASTPGWTGRTVVRGSTSSVAADAAATEQQQKWQLGPSR